MFRAHVEITWVLVAVDIIVHKGDKAEGQRSFEVYVSLNRCVYYHDQVLQFADHGYSNLLFAVLSFSSVGIVQCCSFSSHEAIWLLFAVVIYSYQHTSVGCQ